jgi:DNA-binding beta-propeller fold protein YncE
VAISHETGQGFSDDGRNGQAIAFDLKTLQIKARIPADMDADAVGYDPGSGHVCVMDGDPHKATVVDPTTDKAIASIDLGEGPEYAKGADGAIFISGAGNKDLIKVDPKTNSVVAHWPTPDCERPHGLAVDGKSHRAFMGCVNAKMMVVDTRNGKLVAELDIGKGNDAMAFDPTRKRVFSSNGRDGTITVYQEVTPDKYDRPRHRPPLRPRRRHGPGLPGRPAPQDGPGQRAGADVRSGGLTSSPTGRGGDPSRSDGEVRG